MTTLRNDSIGNQLNRARVAIENTLRSADILALVGPVGYPLATMNQGKALCTTASTAVDAAAEKSGAQAIASQDAAEKFKTAQAAYQDLAKVARAIFLREPGTLAFLGLDQAMPRAEGEFVRAFTTLFNTGAYTAEIRTRLAAKGYDSGKLSSERATLGAWQFASENHKTCVGAAQVATATQTAALKSLVDWVAEYIKIARVALKGQPQSLEKIGVLVRNAKTKAQREAPAKAAATRQLKKVSVTLPKAA